MKLEVEWTGLSDLIGHFEDMDKNIEKIIVEEFNAYLMLVEQGAKALAPHDTGDLEDSITTTPIRKELGQFVAEIGTNIEYALIVHEYPMNWGKRTRAKRSWRGNRPGNHYISRAVNLTEKDWEIITERILMRVLEGRF